jgi:hypothetical protein
MRAEPEQAKLPIVMDETYDPLMGDAVPTGVGIA